jgi:integrase
LTAKVIAHDPFADLRWPQADELEPEPFTEDERDRIIAWYWEHHRHYYPFVFFQFWTGLRPSESAGIRLGNIDLKSGRLSIIRSRNLGEDNRTKTRASRRTITLFPNVLEVLMKIPRIGTTEQSQLFTNTEGGVIVPDNFRSQYWYNALTALKIRPRKFYCTRHTFISVMLLHNENINRVADYAGTSVQMIDKHYRRFMSDDPSFGMRAIRQSEKQRENILERVNEKQQQSIDIPKKVSRRPRRDLNPFHSDSSKSNQLRENLNENTQKDSAFEGSEIGRK